MFCSGKVEVDMKLSKVGPRILVSDFKACFDFYKDVIGYDVLWGDRDNVYASFKVEDEFAFAIFQKENMSQYSGYEELSGLKSDSVVLTIGVDDVDLLYNELLKKGVRFIGEPRDIPKWFMRCVYLRDPEENLIELSGPIK